MLERLYFIKKEKCSSIDEKIVQYSFEFYQDNEYIKQIIIVNDTTVIYQN